MRHNPHNDAQAQEMKRKLEEARKEEDYDRQQRILAFYD